MAIKDKVLELLDDNKGKYLSGEQLADTLGYEIYWGPRKGPLWGDEAQRNG